MSAFVCSDLHIATVAQSYCRDTGMNKEWVQVIADHLKRLNVDGVNYRYSEDDRFTPCAINVWMAGYKPHDLAALAECLLYQSQENPRNSMEALQAIIDFYIAKSDGKSNSMLWSI